MSAGCRLRPPSADGSAPASSLSVRRRPLRRLLGRQLPTAARTALAVLVVLVAAMATADLWRPLDTLAVSLGDALTPPGAAHPMGTDTLGRDVLALALHGLRTSFTVSFLAALLAGVLGATMGLTAGTFGGRVDAVVMRVVDVFASQSHFLFGILVLVLARPVTGPAVAIMLAVGLTHWVSTARIVRGELLTLRERPFVAAAVNAGADRRQLVRHHLLPNVLPSVVLAFVLTVPHAIFHEAGYSFLGLGMPAESPSLGNVLADSQRSVLSGGWWVGLYPGLLLFVMAASIGTLGEWWRDRYDPHAGSELQL